eukprot:scaffold17560_cov72-Skeletonema_dohrnii-CCMP3373.AAC.1
MAARWRQLAATTVSATHKDIDYDVLDERVNVDSHLEEITPHTYFTSAIDADKASVDDRRSKVTEGELASVRRSGQVYFGRI